MEVPRQPPSAPGWHSLPVDDVFSRLGSGSGGLSPEDAARRLTDVGPNRLPPSHRRSALARFAAQFGNVLIIVLVAGAVITAFLREWADTAVILGVVLINGIVGYLQEGRAERALEAIGSMLSHRAAVRRDGLRTELPAEELVPGDVVLLQAGDRVPADLRLFACRGLSIDEAILTGESVPADKSPGPVSGSTALGDRSGMAWSGTLVTAGTGAGVTVATGAATEVGRISALLSATPTLATPLTRALDRFARQLSVVIGVVAALAFCVGVLVHGYPPGDMFVAAVAIAVAAIPEGLPAIITIALAIGVTRMAARNAIIRHLPAVETLGSVAVICTDKTGTLTRNEMTVLRVAVAGRSYAVTGTGYDAHGAFRLDDREPDPAEDPLLQALCRAGALCGDATLTGVDGRLRLHGDPTEGALVVLAMKAGMEPARLAAHLPRDDAIPFEAEQRYMATLHHDHEGRRLVFAKGAPEQILAMCAGEATRDGTAPLDAPRWRSLAETFAAEGLRVLAVAAREAPELEGELREADVDGRMILLGLVGLIDPPRPEAIEAVKRCRKAGIRVKMVTGDHLITARAIADAMGIGTHGSALSGADLEAMDDAELERVAPQVDVYARASPDHKLRLVAALQAGHQVLAMTGDGVNDAPALKRADVGVAMGRGGTEAAREAARMVLSDDNFASIASAVEEGRIVYDNIRKAIIYVLPTSIAEGLIVLAAILLGLPLPITPLQILWVNMITAVTLSLALAVEPAEGDVMQRPPRGPDEPLLDRLLVWRVAFVSAVLLGGVATLFAHATAAGATLETARTIAVNALVMFEAFYLLSARHITTPVLNREGFFGNRVALAMVVVVVMLQLLMTYVPVMQQLFGTAPLAAVEWARLLAVSVLVVPLVEAEKLVVRRRTLRTSDRHAGAPV